MRILGYELMLTLRRLWRRRVQSGLMLATFTVSIALSLLSWSLFHTMFLKNPAFDPGGKLYRVTQTGGMAKDQLVSSSREDIEAWQKQQVVFSDFGIVRLYESVFVTTEAGQERLLSANVSAAALRMVNARPLLGRLFTADEDKMGTTPVVLLSERTWRNRFAADPNILGRMIKLDGVPAAVIGVMPADFRFPNDQDILQPLGFIPFEKSPQFNIHDVLVRLKPGLTPARAVEDLRLITERRGKETMAARFDLRPSVTPFRDYYILSDMNRSALVLFVLALVFVLVSCANAANLVMIDFLGRTNEIASSLALGIPRGAAVRALCFQVAIVAATAAVLSTIFLLLVAPLVHGAMVRITTPYWLLFSLEWHHLAMAAALAATAAGVAIVAPLDTCSC
ncbi:MAG: hypothetical protein JWM32_639 [Verrucomicrobia bacterium]|nr:hypothetical protein [Verrucomicrobiota bacterium]